MSKKRPSPPAALSAEAKTFYREIVSEYDLTDVAGLKLLLRACEALERLRQAQKEIRSRGVVVRDAKGSIKTNPAVNVERDAHKQFVEALRALNLDVEPLKAIGRPVGS